MNGGSSGLSSGFRGYCRVKFCHLLPNVLLIWADVELDGQGAMKHLLSLLELNLPRIDSSLKRSSTVGKMLLSILCYREIIRERMSQLLQETSLSYFKKLPQPSTFSTHHPDQSAAINSEVRPTTNKKFTIYGRLRGWLTFLSDKVFFN